VPAAAASVGERKTLPWLVAGYSDGTVRLFDLNRVEMALKMHPHASATTAVCFSADGSVYQCCIVLIFLNCNGERPLPSNRQYLSYDARLDVKREDNKNYSVLCCVRQLCTVISTLR